MKNKFLKGLVASFALAVSGVVNAGLIDYGSSGVSNDGTLANGASIVNDSYYGLNALSTSSNSRLDFGGDLTEFDMLGGYSFMTWFKTDTMGYSGILQFGNCCSPRNGYSLQATASGLRFWGGSDLDNSNYNIFTDVNYADNQWHHIGVNVGDNGLTSIFFDGSVLASSLFSNMTDTSPSLAQGGLGASVAPYIGGENVDGQVISATKFYDDIQVFSRSLSNSEWSLAASQDGIRGDVLYMNFEEPVDVPEPSTFAIFALGIIGLASRKFKKQA